MHDDLTSRIRRLEHQAAARTWRSPRASSLPAVPPPDDDSGRTQPLRLSAHRVA